MRSYKIENNEPPISATRLSAAVIFGVRLSARAAFRLDPEYSGLIENRPKSHTGIQLTIMGNGHY